MKPITLISIALIAATATPALAQLGMMRGGGDGADWFAKADANGDDVVTRAEFMAYRDGNFGRLDRNGDGAISPADFPRLAKMRPDAYQKLTAAMGNADRNGDGAISRAEMKDSPPRMFDMADADRDGRVTKAEFDAARERMRAMIEARRN